MIRNKCQLINLTSVSFSILKAYANAKNIQIEGDRRKKQSYIDCIQTYWDATGITKLIEVNTIEVTKFIANELNGSKEPELIDYAKDTPEGFLQQLAKVNDADAEALNLLDTDLLEQIVANPDKYGKMREAIAANCSVTKILESLAKDKNVAVRAAVASNSNTTPKILELLKEDPKDIVRKSVVKHPNLSFYSFTEFLKDEDYLISSIASKIAGQHISSVLIYIGDDAASEWLREQKEYEGSVTDFDSVDDFKESDISYTEMYEACGFLNLEIRSKNNNRTDIIDFDEEALLMLYALSDGIDRKEIELDIYWG